MGLWTEGLVQKSWKATVCQNLLVGHNWHCCLDISLLRLALQNLAAWPLAARCQEHPHSL